jgi:hypothetical protein
MHDNGEVKVPKRILNSLLSSLSAGVVPRVGAPYIAIGRTEEIAALLESLENVADGGAAVRFLIGRYGSGKSFLIQLIRGFAMERGFLCADADLSTDQRRLCGGGGAGLATYRELLRNLASKACPDGGALPVVLSRHYASLLTDLASDGIMPENPVFKDVLRKKVLATFSVLESSVGGFDFARVVGEYFIASADENEERKSACLRWLRGEFSNKTEAKAELGFRISTVIDDENWYDFIKLWAVFSRHLGYKGLIVYIDECIILYKIVNRVSRESNYEKLLTIFNDTLQGRAEGLGVIFGGTPQFLEDTRRGLFSYEALKSRLTDSRFSDAGYRTLSSPVIRLRRFSDNELYALLTRLTKLHASASGTDELISAEEQKRFLAHCLSRAGASELLTPRELIRDYLTLLNILRDNPTATFDEVLKTQAPSLPSDAEAEDAKASAPLRGAGVGLADLDF